MALNCQPRVIYLSHPGTNGLSRLAANRINAFIFGSSCGRDFSITVQPIQKKFTVLETVIQWLHFPLYNLFRHFCSLNPKIGFKWAYRRLRVTQMADIDFLGWCRIVVAVSSHMRVDARSCVNVFGISESKY